MHALDCIIYTLLTRFLSQKANEALYIQQPDNERRGLLQNNTHTDVFRNVYSRKEQFIGETMPIYHNISFINR